MAFSAREAVVEMVQHFETLLIQTKMMKSDQPFVGEGLELVAEVKKALGNRCFLTTRMLDELRERGFIDREIDNGEEEDA